MSAGSKRLDPREEVVQTVALSLLGAEGGSMKSVEGNVGLRPAFQMKMLK